MKKFFAIRTISRSGFSSVHNATFAIIFGNVIFLEEIGIIVQGFKKIRVRMEYIIV